MRLLCNKIIQRKAVNASSILHIASACSINNWLTPISVTHAMKMRLNLLNYFVDASLPSKVLKISLRVDLVSLCFNIRSIVRGMITETELK